MNSSRGKSVFCVGPPVNGAHILSMIAAAHDSRPPMSPNTATPFTAVQPKRQAIAATSGTRTPGPEPRRGFFSPTETTAHRGDCPDSDSWSQATGISLPPTPAAHERGPWARMLPISSERQRRRRPQSATPPSLVPAPGRLLLSGDFLGDRGQQVNQRLLSSG